MSSLTRAQSDESLVKPTSIFAATLAGTPPSLRRSPPPSSVRRHALDDVAQGRAPAKTAEPQSHRPATNSPRDFTAADRALIRRVHGYMSSLQLLGILNERLVCDLGHAATPFTIEQLHAEIASVSSAVPSNGDDWAGMRKLLAKARCAGVLELITEQVINDFAVVYSLNQKQVLTLKDIVLQAREEQS